MKAIVIHAAGDLRIEQRPEEALGPGEVLVGVRAGGICGSDMHYYRHGGFGAVRLKEPMILGHEVAGEVRAVAPDVTRVAVGDRVAVNPSRPCGRCAYCLEGLPNHCEHMRFYGSAMPMPHIQGAFRSALVCAATQCEVVPASVPYDELALCEPFAVTLHAMRRAGSLLGKSVLVTGSGPIGVLCVAAARHCGARHVTATDVMPEPLAVATRLGADRTIDIAADPAALGELARGKGTIDVLFECSGNEAALRSGLATLRPRGTLVQLGLAGADPPLPLNTIVAKEIDFKGTFRFHEEFALAAELIATRRVDLRPILSRTFPADDAVAAFEAAGDRRTAMKVHLDFA